jgi:SnoaL-like domain
MKVTQPNVNNGSFDMLRERLAVQDVLARYFRGIDSRDRSMVESCFAHDVAAFYEGRPRAKGRSELLDILETFKPIDSGRGKITTHFMGNFYLDRIAERAAETEILATVYVVQPKADGSQSVTIKGLRYFDSLRRGQSGWKITERRHTVDWICEARGTYATTVAGRIHRKSLEDT